MTDRSSPDSKTLLAFAGAVVIGGVNFLAVKLSNEELAPLFGATIRFAGAALLLFAIAFARRTPLPKGRAAWGAALYGLLGFGFAYGLLYFALVGLGPGTTSVVMAAVPLVTLILAVVHRQERFSLRGVVGGLLAIAGIALLSTNSVSGDVRPIYFLSALLAVVAVAESSVVIKGFPKADPITTNAVGMAVGTVFLSVVSLVRGEPWVVPQTAQTWVVLAWLIALGSIGLFVLFLYVIARWTASASVYALTLMPVIAVTLGTLFADEKLSLELLGGGALVLVAVYVGALSQPSGAGAGVPETP